ncbi:uncharacterized protein C8Q71DRAFT_754738 [Rhodofomes roseus]|uniref:Uncharacterized protein n=1 Tax=Rhodofomes roseus TaxID=34475 RepID=A0ABQ8KK74_9APHY|nr:uncharacterized protein C8Q71DRAFT_754738 [Rhodofomes roseus]KAH9837834.1 hypothetical protein C8Q71DRAFT_754738 [Rhodofomes roseus]
MTSLRPAGLTVGCHGRQIIVFVMARQVLTLLIGGTSLSVCLYRLVHSNPPSMPPGTSKHLLSASLRYAVEGYYCATALTCSKR